MTENGSFDRRMFLGTAAATTATALVTSPLNAAPTSYSRSDRLVMTYLFSWYDWKSRAHIVTGNPPFDYLSVHPSPQTTSYDRNANYRSRKPPTVDGQPILSYTNATWFQQQLTSMTANAVDAVAFDYWGFTDANVEPRSKLAAATLNTAMNNLDQTGMLYPAVCLFLETVPLGNSGTPTDLRTEAGANRLFGVVRDFYSQVNRSRWLTVDGRAVVILYAAGIDGLTIAPFGLRRCREMFQNQFSTGLTFIGNSSWQSKAGSEISYSCGWGAAIRTDRLIEATDLMQVSPGYNYLGNTKGCPRNLDAYRTAWELARRQSRNWIAIETWNEWHEGTGIASTLEDGIEFLKITQSQARRFQQRT